MNDLERENEALKAVLAETLTELHRNVIFFLEIDGPVLHKECRAEVARMIERKLKERNIEIQIKLSLVDKI